MYEIVADVRRFSAAENVRVGLALLRFAARESRVEILNAGMPPILRFSPGAEPAVHYALSTAVGARFGEVHPYELSPLVWGSSWALFSAGVTGGSHEPAELLRRVAGSTLELRASELAGQSSAALESVVARLAAASAPLPDRTLVVVDANPRRRIESGVEAR
jgi:hypothetical protein